MKVLTFAKDENMQFFEIPANLSYEMLTLHQLHKLHLDLQPCKKAEVVSKLGLLGTTFW